MSDHGAVTAGSLPFTMTVRQQLPRMPPLPGE
jgi:hypothetical protein